MPKKKRSLAWSLFKGTLLMAGGGVVGAIAVKQWDKHIGKNAALRLQDKPDPTALPEPPQYPGMAQPQPVAAYVTGSPLTPILPQFFAPPMPAMPPMMQMPTQWPVPSPPGAPAAADPAMVALAAREAKAKRKRDDLDRAYKEFMEED